MAAIRAAAEEAREVNKLARDFFEEHVKPNFISDGEEVLNVRLLQETYESNLKPIVFKSEALLAMVEVKLSFMKPKKTDDGSHPDDAVKVEGELYTRCALDFVGERQSLAIARVARGEATEQQPSSKRKRDAPYALASGKGGDGGCVLLLTLTNRPPVRVPIPAEQMVNSKLAVEALGIAASGWLGPSQSCVKDLVKTITALKAEKKIKEGSVPVVFFAAAFGLYDLGKMGSMVPAEMHCKVHIYPAGDGEVAVLRSDTLVRLQLECELQVMLTTSDDVTGGSKAMRRTEILVGPNFAAFADIAPQIMQPGTEENVRAMKRLNHIIRTIMAAFAHMPYQAAIFALVAACFSIRHDAILSTYSQAPLHYVAHPDKNSLKTLLTILIATMAAGAWPGSIVKGADCTWKYLAALSANCGGASPLVVDDIGANSQGSKESAAAAAKLAYSMLSGNFDLSTGGTGAGGLRATNCPLIGSSNSPTLFQPTSGSDARGAERCIGFFPGKSPCFSTPACAAARGELRMLVGDCDTCEVFPLLYKATAFMNDADEKATHAAECGAISSKFRISERLASWVRIAGKATTGLLELGCKFPKPPEVLGGEDQGALTREEVLDVVHGIAETHLHIWGAGGEYFGDLRKVVFDFLWGVRAVLLGVVPPQPNAVQSADGDERDEDRDFLLESGLLNASQPANDAEGSDTPRRNSPRSATARNPPSGGGASPGTARPRARHAAHARGENRPKC